jgi:membrane-anchored glycerophosphoryl diester phosphodiesterase (GDPDase)
MYKSIGQIFSESAAAVRRNISLFIFLNTLTILSTAWDVGISIRDRNSGNGWAQSIFHTFNGNNGQTSFNSGLGTLFVLLIIAGSVLYILTAILSVMAAKNRTVSFSEVWDCFKKTWWKIILVALLSGLLVIAGLLAFIIPGLYLLSRLVFAWIIVIDKKTGVIEALNQSWDLTKGRAWIVFVTLFFGVLLGIISAVPVIGPIISTALAIAYSVALPLRYYELKAAGRNG